MNEDRNCDTGVSKSTKRKIKRAYLKAEIGLSDAVPALMFEHDMMRGEAIRYLMDG